MFYIKNYVEERYHDPLLLGPLLVQCSIHNNTNGQFSAYYKNEEKTKGMYGGKGLCRFKTNNWRDFTNDYLS